MVLCIYCLATLQGYDGRSLIRFLLLFCSSLVAPSAVDETLQRTRLKETLKLWALTRELVAHATGVMVINLVSVIVVWVNVEMPTDLVDDGAGRVALMARFFDLKCQLFE